MTYAVLPFTEGGAGSVRAAHFEAFLNRMEDRGWTFVQDLGHGLIVFHRPSEPKR